jgi:hypothetical protein
VEVLVQSLADQNMSSVVILVPESDLEVGCYLNPSVNRRLEHLQLEMFTNLSKI